MGRLVVAHGIPFESVGRLAQQRRYVPWARNHATYRRVQKDEAANLISMSTWRRICAVGLVVHGVFISTVAVSAYQGSLWVHLPDIPNLDTAGHFGLIGLVAFFLDGVLGYRPLMRNRVTWLRVAPLAVLSVAAIEELAQRLSPNRTSSWSDLAADAVGITFFSWLSWFAYRALGQRSTASSTSGTQS